jgi:hypothetical protein
MKQAPTNCQERLTATVRYARIEGDVGFVGSPLTGLKRVDFFKFTMTQVLGMSREWLHLSLSCATKLKPLKEKATPCPATHLTKTIRRHPANGDIALNENWMTTPRTYQHFHHLEMT